MQELHNTIYSLEASASEKLASHLRKLHERVDLLRGQGHLTPDTLQSYYGAKRMEQVAESNALEGSTLSVGETELAVLKGATLTGHNPRFVRDAIDLDAALRRLAELARDSSPTNVEQLQEVHGLVLGKRPGAGIFRRERVRIAGAKHVPPKTWERVMAAMESWESWSLANPSTSPLIRGTVLHAWLAHIHPYIDGNGRTARAVTNLELVRGGFPPIIIKKKDRPRYLEALATSDEAGDLGPFFDLVLSREEGALRGLELAARKAQGYDPAGAKIKRAQSQRLQIWNRSVELLYDMLLHELESTVGPHAGEISGHVYPDSLELDDYIDLCSGRAVSRSWCFRLKCSLPGLGGVERLAWAGYRSESMRDALPSSDGGGPSLFWSAPNPAGYPPWIKAWTDAPSFVEMTTVSGRGDDWYVLDADEQPRRMTTSQAVEGLARGFIDLATARGK